MRVRIGKDIKIKWAVLTDGSALPLNKEELTLELAGPNGKSQSMEFEMEGNVLTAMFYGKDQNYTGDYMLTLWKNKGKEGQSVVDKTSAFSLVRYTPQEDLAQKHDNLSATLADLGDTSLVTIDGASETTLVCNLTGYKAVEDVSDLPMEPSTIGYLVGDNLYVYVGEGGDVRLGAYKNCGPFRGLKGDTGAQGNSGYQGAAGELQVVNNLTEGGETAALSAEQGKVLDGKKQDNLQTYHETDDYKNASVGIENVFHAEASCGDKDTRSALLIIDKDETEVAEERTAMLYTENDITGNGNYIQAGKDAVLLKSSKPGTASEVQVSPDTVAATASEVSVKATGGVKFETQGTDSTSAYIEMLGGDKPDLDIRTDSKLTIFGNNSVAIESDNNISVTANSNIALNATDNISMSSPSVKIKDVVGTIKELVDYMATDKTDDEQISNTLNQHEARFEELTNSVQMLQDETEDLQSMRDTIDNLGTDKADKSALEATNRKVAKKQDILQGYREDHSNGAVEIFGQEKVSMSTDYHENIAEVSTYYEDSENGAVPVARIESTYESDDYAYVEARGNEVNIVGDYVNVNGFDLMQTIEDVATLNGTGNGSVSKTVTDEIAKVVANAPSDFDTLKEIADYIASDKTNAADINNTLTALKTRIYELGDFATSGAAENAAKNPSVSGNKGISIIHYTVNGSTEGLILQHQDIDGGYHRSVQTLLYHSRMYVRFVWFTDSTRTVLLENANFNKDWWETSISHLEYDKTTHTIKCRRIGQDVNLTKWITLPSASTSTDGLMTKAQVKSLEGKQDQLVNYVEIPRRKTTIKYPNGTARVEVSNARAGLWANDDKVAIAADANGTRMLYTKTAEDGSIEHGDEISIGRHADSRATHITLTSKSTTEDTGEKITNTSTIQVNPDGIAMSSPSGEIDDVVKEISEKASSESVSELRQEVEDKAPKVGYAPDLKVNFAKELFGRGEATPEVIGSIRPTGVRSIGDGNATITKIKGESVVWNQFAPVISPSTVVPINTKVAQYTYDQDKVTITTIQEVSNDYSAAVKIPSLPHIAQHKYLIQFCAEAQNVNVYIKAITKKNVNGKQSIAAIYKASTNDNAYEPYIAITSGAAIGSTLEISNISWYDLTLMFGAGNEPTTIEDFEARKPLGVSNEYNEGTIVSYNGEALKSVGFNAWDEERELGSFFNGAKVETTTTWRNKNDIVVVPNKQYRFEIGSPIYINAFDRYGNYLYAQRIAESVSKTFDKNEHHIWIRPYDDATAYNNDICIHLAHSGYRNGEYKPYEANTHLLPNVKSILDADGNQLFPHGLLSAGSVHDEITATKAIKRVGVVDMGTLDWTYVANSQISGTSFRCKIADRKNNRDSFTNVLCGIYSTIDNSVMENTSFAGPALLGNAGLFGPVADVSIVVKDPAYTTAADFKAAMNGVLLYYELAEPIEVDLPEPLNMTYEAWDFGTEELIAEGATTPLNADIVYQFNAVDRIRENSKHVEESEEKLTNLQQEVNTLEETKADKTEVEALSEEVATKQNELTLTVLDNGNIRIGNLQGQSQEFMPATPSGDPMHYAYVSAGAEYNATGVDKVKDAPWKDYVDTEEEKKVVHKAGHWYLNGLGDLTTQEIRETYINGRIQNTNMQSLFRNQGTIRTNVRFSPIITGGAYDSVIMTAMFASASKLEVAYICNGNSVKTSSSLYIAFDYDAKLKHIMPALKVDAVKDAQSSKSFNGCSSLVSVALQNICTNWSLKASRFISKTSILYAINNATPTSAITITLHHDAYERLKGDADILQALTTKNADLANTGDGKGKVSLVCATDNDTIPSE